METSLPTPMTARVYVNLLEGNEWVIKTGWWFGTWLLFSIIFHNIWVVILPIDFHIFQRGWNHQPDKNYGNCRMFFFHELNGSFPDSQSDSHGNFGHVRLVNRNLVQDIQASCLSMYSNHIIEIILQMTKTFLETYMISLIYIYIITISIIPRLFFYVSIWYCKYFAKISWNNLESKLNS